MNLCFEFPLVPIDNASAPLKTILASSHRNCAASYRSKTNDARRHRQTTQHETPGKWKEQTEKGKKPRVLCQEWQFPLVRRNSTKIENDRLVVQLMTEKKQTTRLQSLAKLGTPEKWSRACLPFCHEMGVSRDMMEKKQNTEKGHSEKTRDWVEDKSSQDDEN